MTTAAKIITRVAHLEVNQAMTAPQPSAMANPNTKQRATTKSTHKAPPTEVPTRPSTTPKPKPLALS